MSRVNSDIHYFLDRHEQEIINCCKKAMSNKEIIELLKTKYDREVSLTTFKEFKAGLKLTKGDFLETLLDEIQVMKTQGATDESVRRWLDEEHKLEVSRATFSRFKKKYNLTDNDKDPKSGRFLMKMSWFKHRDYIMIKHNYSPYDRTKLEYFENRKDKYYL